MPMITNTRSPHLVDVNGDFFFFFLFVFLNNWGEWRSCTCTCTYVRARARARPSGPRSTATLRMRERCSDSADLANQQLFVSGPGNVSTRGQVIDINRSPKIEIPRLRKRQHSAPGSLSQLSPREAERLRDGYI